MALSHCRLTSLHCHSRHFVPSESAPESQTSPQTVLIRVLEAYVCVFAEQEGSVGMEIFDRVLTLNGPVVAVCESCRRIDRGNKSVLTAGLLQQDLLCGLVM